MRIPRIFVPISLQPGRDIDLPTQAGEHVARVLRLDRGQPLRLFDGSGAEYTGEIASLAKRAVTARVLARVESADRESPLRITLGQGIARGEKMDWILQKATELGVASVHPVHSDRSEVKLEGERATKRLAHWQGVVVSACEQSGRARIPEVAAAQALPALLTGALPSTRRFLLDPEAEDAIATMPPLEGDCVLAVGPEGGWSPRDRQALQAAGFVGLKLGPRILRTETAGIAAIAALQARFGDLR